MIATFGTVAFVVTASVAVATEPLLSVAVTVSTFRPGWSGMSSARQTLVPLATPLPPRSLDHLTCETATLSLAQPESVRRARLVA